MQEKESWFLRKKNHAGIIDIKENAFIQEC